MNQEICPDCGERVVLKAVGESLMCYEQDGTIHKCVQNPEYHYTPKPLGQSIEGKTILSFHLKRRVATLVLSDNFVLEIYAASGDDLVAMNLRLVSPGGIIEEKK